MKIFISTFLLSATVHAAVLPSNIFLNDKTGFEVTDDQVTSLEGSVGELVDLNSNVVEGGLPNTGVRSGDKWKASGYVTSLGVTSSGKLGILGFKGSAMAEIFWRKKLANKIFGNDLAISEQTETELSDLSESGINESLEHLMAIVIGSRKVENPENVRAGLRQKLTEFAGLVRGTRTDQNKPWYLAGIRLDLAVSGSGALTPIYTVGAALNLRVVWVPVKAKNLSPLASGMNSSSSLSKMTEDLTQVLAEIADNQVLEANGLALSTVRFGLGVTAAGKVFFGKGDGSLVFSVLMNKNSKYVPPPASKQSNFTGMRNSALPVEDNSEIQDMDWKLFKKGLEKALRLSRSFVRKNDPEKEQKRKWEVYSIRTSYSMNLTKGVGLITVGEIAQLQMTYKK